MDDKNNGPLLEENKEVIPFAEDNTQNSGKTDNKVEEKKENQPLEFLKKMKPKMKKYVNILAIVIVSFFFLRTSYAFYVGFKYYDLHFETAKAPTKTETVPLSEEEIKELFNKIKIDSSNELFSKFYSGLEVVGEKLDPNEQIILLLSNTVDCDNLSTTVGYSVLEGISMSLFNNTRISENIGTMSYGKYHVMYNEDHSLTITLDECQNTNDFVVHEYNRSEQINDEVYIYEKFGYLKYIEDNKYEIYNDINSDSGIQYIDEYGNKTINDIEILANYRWTYKKGTDNNYYFVSLTRV